MKAQAIKVMKDYFRAPALIEHALVVTAFAEQIAAAERVEEVFVQQVVILAGIFHDVGIPVAVRKHGSGAGPWQELEGEAIARRLLQELGVRPDIRERVCYIVRHHHSPQYIDGLDMQIIFEADALVNIPNRFSKNGLQNKDDLKHMIAQTFCTPSGKALIRDWAKGAGF